MNIAVVLLIQFTNQIAYDCCDERRVVYSLTHANFIFFFTLSVLQQNINERFVVCITTWEVPH